MQWKHGWGTLQDTVVQNLGECSHSYSKTREYKHPRTKSVTWRQGCPQTQNKFYHNKTYLLYLSNLTMWNACIGYLLTKASIIVGNIVNGFVDNAITFEYADVCKFISPSSNIFFLTLYFLLLITFSLNLWIAISLTSYHPGSFSRKTHFISVYLIFFSDPPSFLVSVQLSQKIAV